MARQMICVVVKHKHKSNIKHRKHTVCSLTDQWPASLKLTQEPSVGKLVTGSQKNLFGLLFLYNPTFQVLTSCWQQNVWQCHELLVWEFPMFWASCVSFSFCELLVLWLVSSSFVSSSWKTGWERLFSALNLRMLLDLVASWLTKCLKKSFAKQNYAKTSLDIVPRLISCTFGFGQMSEGRRFSVSLFLLLMLLYAFFFFLRMLLLF